MDNIQLRTLQLLVDKELSFKPENQGRVSIYPGEVQPLVIFLEEYLRNRDYVDKEERRDIRLYIYSQIVRRPITTTYDLSSYQCRCILGYIREPVTYDPTEDGAELLEFLTQEFEGTNIQRESYEDRVEEQLLEEAAGLPDL